MFGHHFKAHCVYDIFCARSSVLSSNMIFPSYSFVVFEVVLHVFMAPGQRATPIWPGCMIRTPVCATTKQCGSQRKAPGYHMSQQKPTTVNTGPAAKCRSS